MPSSSQPYSARRESLVNGCGGAWGDHLENLKWWFAVCQCCAHVPPQTLRSTLVRPCSCPLSLPHFVVVMWKPVIFGHFRPVHDRKSTFIRYLGTGNGRDEKGLGSTRPVNAHEGGRSAPSLVRIWANYQHANCERIYRLWINRSRGTTKHASCWHPSPNLTALPQLPFVRHSSKQRCSKRESRALCRKPMNSYMVHTHHGSDCTSKGAADATGAPAGRQNMGNLYKKWTR